ncbi:hypothetical protein [Rhizobium mongolense]|uniref:DUF1049 domain-containing protein n=2 Tax=Rhizobium mongolense TaxID=57676 RepID=A0ABR6IN66_9HYPH|nr:hypothetical protein [Rhizobium mongolense]MBB4229328.1 hypothetical protein [Rhizobium mongolense]TVZ63126.1 hypothetical protein BCL32_3247 [Rhizobium mongolense USDA 1844]
MLFKISSRNIILTIFVMALSLTAVFLSDKTAFGGKIASFLGPEPFKLTLQFLLITVLGGALSAFLMARKEEEARDDTKRKDNQARRDTRIANLQALDGKLAEAHRHMKSSKRRLRSRLDRTDPKRPTIAKSDFEECMDQLLTAQIAVEEIQDLIATRRDLIKKSDMGLIDEFLQYAARYSHNVFEDFEKGRVKREADRFLLDEVAAPNLYDFLMKSSESELIATQRDIIKDKHRTYEDRRAVLAIVEGQRLFGKVALECMRLASSELKHLIDAELAQDERSTLG